MELIKDLISDFGLEMGPGFWRRKRLYVVKGIPQSNPEIVVDLALTCPGLPTMNVTGHPGRPTAIARYVSVEPCRDIKTGRPAKDRMNVIYTFEEQASGPGTAINPTYVEFGSVERQVMTDTDRDGKTITVYWGGGLPKRQRAEVPTVLSDPVVVFKRWFNVKGSGLTYPTPIETLQLKYNNKVNNNQFRGRPAHYWKAKVTGSTQDKGSSFEIQVLLEGKEGGWGWDEWGWWTHRDGTIPREADKAKGVAVKKVDNLFFEADFGAIENDLNAL